MPDTPGTLVQGSLEVLILKALSLEPLHGLGIARRIEQISKGTFHVKPGSLFPALHRMERMGWVVPSWGQSDAGRRAKFYTLTIAGRRHLRTEAAHWTRLAIALHTSLEAT